MGEEGTETRTAREGTETGTAVTMLMDALDIDTLDMSCDCECESEMRRCSILGCVTYVAKTILT